MVFSLEIYYTVFDILFKNSSREGIEMQRKALLPGIVCILCGVLLTSCKPAMQPGDVSSDAFTASMIANVRPIDDLKAKAKVQKGSGVKVTWSQVSRARSYVISRSVGDGGKDWKILDTLSPEQTSYMDETAGIGKEYHYTVEAYCEYNDTDRFAYENEQMPESLSADCTIYTGVGAAYWSGKNTDNASAELGSIQLEYAFGTEATGDVEPEGVEIYRGTSPKNYKLLERGLVIKKSTSEYNLARNYIDRSVEQGKTYYYQVRAYAVIDGKRVYGEKSKPLKLTAAEPEGKYSVRIAREPGTSSNNMVIALTGTAQENGTLTLSTATLQGKVSYVYRMTEEAYAASRDTGEETGPSAIPYESMALRVSRISSDGRYFSSLGQDVVLNAKETVYLELEPSDSSQELLTQASLTQAQLFMRAKYNEGVHGLQLDLKRKQAALTDVFSNPSLKMWPESAGKGKLSSLKVAVVSSLAENKAISWMADSLKSVDYAYQLKNDDEVRTMSLRVEKYSTDGVNWNTLGKKKIILKPFETLYLKFIPVSGGETIPYRLKGQRHADIRLAGQDSQKKPWELTLDLSGSKVK